MADIPSTGLPTLSEITAHKLVPVVVINDADQADALGEILFAAGSQLQK